jgi:hypothetical protein
MRAACFVSGTALVACVVGCGSSQPGLTCVTSIADYCGQQQPADPVCESWSSGAACAAIPRLDVESCSGYLRAANVGVDAATLYFYDARSLGLVAILATSGRDGSTYCVAGPRSFIAPESTTCTVDVADACLSAGCGRDAVIPCGSSGRGVRCLGGYPDSTKYVCSMPQSNADGTQSYCCIPSS